MRAIVTGGAGFIGSNVVDALVARGDEVHVLDNLSEGVRENVHAEAQLHVADVRDPNAVFDAARPEVVFHLAAQVDVRVSVADPVLDADVNVLGTIRILEAARRHDAKVVFASSGGATYGECDGPAPESAPLRPLAPYGTSKLAGEVYLSTWNRLYGSGHVSLRLGNVYGPRQTPLGEAGVVAIFMGLLHDSGTPTIFGDGSQTRDYVFVDDVSNAMVRAVDEDGGVYNVGTGAETSVTDLYAAIRKATSVDRDPFFAPARLGELQRSVLDPSLADRRLDWHPRHTLTDGLATTWKWICD
ncbi:MAG TPA: NAD-dependent epimerase/dehydratase family protein [Gaiellaceae bacterium]|nr:NAD-dependent epimerase/dehydratase family protein [Gaiellaceae bacterium]